MLSLFSHDHFLDGGEKYNKQEMRSQAIIRGGINLQLAFYYIYTIRYKLVMMLGPKNSPIQKIILPKTFLPFSILVLDSIARGIWLNCMKNRYPLTFLNKQNITSSCTSADRRNVANVAAPLESLNAEMELWYT